MVYVQLLLYIVAIILQITNADKCKTPNNEDANCVSLYDCPVLLNVLSDRTVREFVRQSTCGGTPADPLVCCGTSSNFTGSVVKKEAASLLASKRICGFQHSDDYYHTVNGTVITEFPWLALITYSNRETGKQHNVSVYCSGSLINERYILTAAHCLTNKRLKATGVRLGEFYIKNDTDCMEESDIVECSDSIIDLGIEKSIVHPGYVLVPNSTYDIGLLRMNGSVMYSDYIRPICLPGPETTKPKAGDLLVASGWGSSKSFYVSDKKKKVYSEIVTKEECEKIYANGNYIIELQESQLCGLLKSDDEITCNGDGGSPVIRSFRSQWYQIGIVSFGTKSCISKYPEVYTNVSYFLSWIEENLEPWKKH